MRRIWLCADDYGISAGVGLAIRDLVVRGRLNATSVLVLAAACHRSEALALAALNATMPRVAIGLHVALTAPFRPLHRDFRTLADGAFMPLGATVRHAFLRRFDQVSLVAELNAQLDRFCELFGRAPDYIDGHHHVHLLPQVRDALLVVAKARAANAWIRQCGRGASLISKLGDYKGFFLDLLSRDFQRRAAAAGLRTNPAFAGTYEFNADADFAALFPRFLDRLPEGSVVMCHPGFVDAELQRLDPLTTLREREYAFLAGDSFPRVLAALDVGLLPAT
jgi:chitin disaccharide deacetylase